MQEAILQPRYVQFFFFLSPEKLKFLFGALERLAAHVSLHEGVECTQESEVSTVTEVHVHAINEDGQLIITQDVNELGDGTIILAPSILQVIQSTEDISDTVPESEMQENDKQWSIEVVIDGPE